MSSRTTLKTLCILLTTLLWNETHINGNQLKTAAALANTYFLWIGYPALMPFTSTTTESQLSPSTSLLEHQRLRRARRKRGRLRRRREISTDEPTALMNHGQFQAWLDNLFRNQNRATADEIRLMEQSDPILSRYDPETMSPTLLRRRHRRRQSKTFFEDADDTKNADYDDAELGWD
ncbi:hypothetical protein FOL47_009978 [Perkinsus chesapeaki]|uniref:Uncharacterized protein n=1 Tax=Perkinsus chesapeaki TaxID=330153 RepID=A0A7J6L5I1_PERCH|nr:hypothetical protein FOL47_009978 [Perkinsus chesapeaki]